MPKKDSYITEEYLETRLDKLVQELAVVFQSSFFDVQGQIDGLKETVSLLARKIDDGFGKLDGFVGKMNRLDEAEAMNQAAHRRYDDRLTSLETRPTQP